PPSPRDLMRTGDGSWLSALQQTRSDGSQIDQGKSQDHEKHRDRYGGSIAEAAFSEQGLIPVELQDLRRIARPALCHDEDEIEDAKGIHGAEQQGEQERRFQ